MGGFVLHTVIVAERRVRWIVLRLLCNQTQSSVGQEGDYAWLGVGQVIVGIQQLKKPLPWDLSHR